MPGKKKASTRVAGKKRPSSKKQAAAEAARTSTPVADHIVVHGARQNNLQGFDLALPLGKLIVVTGPSGSGKSSLAMQTLYAEGQRRYVETFSPYVRQFFDRMDKPAVDAIEGIPPAVAVEQVNQVRTTRSTVGTITEINDYLKVLFARVARGYCPETGLEVRPDHADSVRAFAKENLEGQQITVLFPVGVPPKASPADFFPLLAAQGFLRVRVYGEILRTDQPEAAKRKSLPAQIHVVQDRLRVAPDTTARLAEAIEAAFHHGKGTMEIEWLEQNESQTKTFTRDWLCPESGIRLHPPTPALFSFNSPQGACPACRGFGKTIGLDINRAIPDHSRTLREGVVKAFEGDTYHECQRDLLRCAKREGISLTTPFADLDEEEREWIVEGDPAYSDPEEAWDAGAWYGVRGFFRWLESRTYKMHVRVFLSRFRSQTICSACGGSRLRPEAHAFRIGSHSLPDLWKLPVADLEATLRAALPENATDRDAKPLDSATDTVRREILSRLSYLNAVGLGYLSLDRETRTLSGGETARVNLTTCLGAALTGTLFVLDEPTVGLHPRDTHRLLDILRALRDRGNTLVVVEHDESVIRAADHLVDIGPGSGHEGGLLLHSGPLASLNSSANARDSLTRAYLAGDKTIDVPATRRTPASWIRIRRASAHNLRHLDADLPTGVFCAITGVSGSGKSTLVHRIVHEQLRLLLDKEPPPDDLPPARVRSFEAPDTLRHVVLVDQSPLARTPRSTPAVYLGLFDTIRTLLTRTEEAELRGLTPGYFSFNSGAGRCQRCSGMGWEKVAMQFLSDLYIICPECNGRRFQSAALEITFQEKNVAEILDLTAREALDFFAPVEGAPGKKLRHALSILCEVGLGYLRLGQPATTLSGGEAQRIKLVRHLLTAGEQESGHTLFILDEPTTGLHFDDVAHLLALFQRLVDGGDSLLVIEHNPDVVKSADWVIDLGPEAGANGGQIVAQGTPEEIASCAASHTGTAIAPLLSARRSLAPAPLARAAEEATAYATRSRAAEGIVIHGAREHNLKEINLTIPRDDFVVVTGLSGSGKSTLAFDIIFAEGQRRFLDSMSPYARQFAEQLEKPDVDHIEGLPPTVAIEQRVTQGGSKSTVGTVTEVYQFLRLLYARIGIQHCPESGLPVVARTEQEIERSIKTMLRKGPVVIMAPLLRGRKGFHTDVAARAARRGIRELFVDRKFVPSDPFKPLERYKIHDIDAVLGRFKTNAKPGAALTKQIRESVAKGLDLGKGTLTILGPDKRLLTLSTSRTSPATGEAFEELEPNTFSFNSPRGWCPSCRGYGFISRSLSSIDVSRAESVADAELQEERRLDSADATETLPCPACEGTRLHPAARAVRVLDHRIEDVVSLSVAEAAQFLSTWKFSGRDAVIARDIMPEILQRLRFMEQTGLGHLQLNRAANTLSGGEAQRIRLAAQLGSNLRGVLYVLDEPTIGLHPRDNEQLLSTLTALRDKGNSLLVVEHDEETIRRAGHIIDLGPGAGRLGGEVVYQGPPEIATKGRRTKPSPTLQALAKPTTPPPPARPLPAASASKSWLQIHGATLHNLQGIDLKIPLGRLTVVSGVSGSGKSSLIRGVVAPAIRAALAAKKSAPASDPRWHSVKGASALTAIYEVDQSPIGRTSRSTPATYVKLFDQIRAVFANLPEARMRGYNASRFSFNTEGGRCEACRGNGRVKLEMAFLPTVWVPCEECGGKRYNPATLEVELKGKSIGDVMAMTIDEATGFFESHPKIHRPLALLRDTGLGYLQLGQPSPTLSGGEAQRIKLVAELVRGLGRSANARLKGRATPGCLYLIEEPTIGLHLEDVARLIDILHRLVDEGHTVVVIEHNIDVIRQADYLVDLGPEAGPGGGTIVASGTPAQVARSKTSRTAPFLR